MYAENKLVSFNITHGTLLLLSELCILMSLIPTGFFRISATLIHYLCTVHTYTKNELTLLLIFSFFDEDHKVYISPRDNFIAEVVRVQLAHLLHGLVDHGLSIKQAC